MVEGGLIADAIAVIASLDPVMGGRRPLMAVFEERGSRRRREILGRYPEGRERSAIMPLLYLAQSVEGHVSRDGLKEVAGLLDLTTAEVEAVASLLLDVSAPADRDARGERLHQPRLHAPRRRRGLRGRPRGRRDAPRSGAVGGRAHHAPRRGVPGRLRLRPGRAGELREPRQRHARADAGADRGLARRLPCRSRRAVVPAMESFKSASRVLAGLEEAPAHERRLRAAAHPRLGRRLPWSGSTATGRRAATRR